MSLKRKTVRLSFLTGIGIFGGLVFHILLGRFFGVSWQMDCLFVSLTLFSWLGVFNTFFTALYVPVFNEVKARSRIESLLFADVVIKCVVAVALVITGIVLIFNEQIVRVIAPGFDAQSVTLCVQANILIVAALVFYSIANIAELTLNALFFYSFPAILGILDPLFNIGALFLLVPSMGIKGIILSYCALNVVKAILLLAYLYGKVGWRPTLRVYHPQLPLLLKQSSQMSLNSFILSSRDIVTRNLASRLGPGAIALFSYAEKMVLILIQVTLVPPVRVFYARICELISLSKWEDVRSIFKQTLKISFMLTGAIFSFCIVFMPAILRLILRNSRFTSGDISVLCVLLGIMLFYFLIITFELYFSRVLYALKRIKIVIGVSLVSTIVMLAAAAIALRGGGINAVAGVFVVSEAAACLLYYYFIRDRLAFYLKDFYAIIIKIGAMAVIFMVLGLYAQMYFSSLFMMLTMVLPAWLFLYVFFLTIFMRKEVVFLLKK